MKTASEDFAKTGISKEFDVTLMDKKRFGDIMAPEIEVIHSYSPSISHPLQLEK